MKRFLLCLLAATAMLASVSCGSDEEEDEEYHPTDESKLCYIYLDSVRLNTVYTGTSVQFPAAPSDTVGRKFMYYVCDGDTVMNKGAFVPDTPCTYYFQSIFDRRVEVIIDSDTLLINMDSTITLPANNSKSWADAVYMSTDSTTYEPGQNYTVTGPVTLKTILTNFKPSSDYIYEITFEELKPLVQLMYKSNYTTHSTIILTNCTDENTDLENGYKVWANSGWYPVDWYFGDVNFDLVIKENEGLTKLGQEAFCNIDGMTSVSIPDCVTELGPGLFGDCSNLVEVKMPAKLKTMSSSVFYGCTSLLSIELPSTLESIDYFAFFECQKLSSIVLPEGLKSLKGTSVFAGTGITELVIPESVETFSFEALYGLSKNTTVKFLGKVQNFPYFYKAIIDWKGSYITFPTGIKCLVPNEYLDYYKTSFDAANKGSFSVNFVGY